jgi:prepilin-type N-terminal cleavage/methylation domain-containing protein
MDKRSFVKGFTLIEILIALAILAIGIGLVAVGFGQLADRDLGNQAKTISAWMQSLSDRSILEGGLYGFRVFGDQVQAVSWFDHQWLLVEHEGLLTLPDNIEFRLSEDQSATGFVTEDEVLKSREGDGEEALFLEEDLIEPLMVFMPSGEPMISGELILQSSSGVAIAIVWTVDGEVLYEDRLPI